MRGISEHPEQGRAPYLTGRALNHLAAGAAKARSYDGGLFESEGLIVDLKDLLKLARLRAEMDAPGSAWIKWLRLPIRAQELEGPQ
jgi:hypothetical protein